MERAKKDAVDKGAGRHSEGNVAQSACHVNFGKLLADFADGVEENQSVFLTRCYGHGQRIKVQIVVRNSQRAGLLQHAADDR